MIDPEWRGDWDGKHYCGGEFDHGADPHSCGQSGDGLAGESETAGDGGWIWRRLGSMRSGTPGIRRFIAPKRPSGASGLIGAGWNSLAEASRIPQGLAQSPVFRASFLNVGAEAPTP